MNLIRLSIERPIAVIAAVLMVVMFGLVALNTIPIQLTPDVNKPVIVVTTNWGGASPAEVEREIVNRQEEKLKGLEGVLKMSGTAEDGQAKVELEFNISMNMDRALLLVANRLDQVEGYPEEADEPSLSTSGTEDNAIAWFILRRLPGETRPIHTFRDFVEDVVQERLERVPGVGRINVYGGSEREMQVVVDPRRMARYGLTVSEIVARLREADASVTAGDVEEGKRRYVVRSEGALNSLDRVRAVVLRSARDAGTGRVARVILGDIAEVRFAYKKPVASIRMLGESAMAMNATREVGANVIEIMDGLRQAVTDLQAGPLPDVGLSMTQVYDETVYIDSAIDLVQQNIMVGGALAVVVLLLFLRSGRATLVVALAIPVSVVGAFVAMAGLGRSLNVISLAGIAFAVGMVVDAAIVVLENIYRLRQQGRSPAEAAYEGARQVWGAVLVSALTTVMVFIPLLTMDLEVGQLFRDIAVAISVSVMLSLVVAITVIPALANRLLRGDPSGGLRLPPIDALGRGFVALVTGFARFVLHHKAMALLIVVAICAVTGGATWRFLPKLEYLPEGNRNLVLGIILPPPGYNLATTTEIAQEVESAVKPYWSSANGPEAEADDSAEGPPRIERFFFVAFRSRTFVGAIAERPERVAELIPILTEPVFKEPGTFGFISQPSIFGRSIGGSRRIELDVTGPDLPEILEAATQATILTSQVMPREQGTQLRPLPGLELGSPEVRLVPDRLRLADSGVTAQELGATIDAFNDGLRVQEITVDGKRLDLTLKGPDNQVSETQGIASLPVVTQSGLIVPAQSLADVLITAGPTEIRHRERQRTVTLEIRPAPGIALEEAIDTLNTQVIAPLRDGGTLPEGIRMRLSGTADELSRTWDAMLWQLLMALAIVYLVMAVLFESFLYPAIIVLSVPLATAGAVGGLVVLNLFHFQPLDMLTLLGFVILIGIVVNNAILLVHQTLYYLREAGMEPGEAIVAATRDRIRPIFMSTLTSVFGMLPLVLFPGAGSELYRGLGSVVVGGLALSALLTLAILPPLLSLTVGIIERRRVQHGTRLRGAPAPGE
jgi:HAE1 family hydrophobic/amphiphilic exporter-1